MYIITWNEKTYHMGPDDSSYEDSSQHKAMTCNALAAMALFGSLTKDIKVIEARIRDDAGNLVPGGFYQKA